MKKDRKPAIRTYEQHFQERGFIKCGANLYRIYGEGLLQIVTIRGFPERVNNTTFNREMAPSFDVQSLYSSIFWNPVKMMPRRDLIPNISPGLMDPNEKTTKFRGTIAEAEAMEEYVIPYLNGMTKHTQMVELFDLIDATVKNGGSVLDSKRIVPYLLAGDKDKALKIISAIELQNWEAFDSNCRILDGYDVEKHRVKINTNLAPLITLREAILKQDILSVFRVLQNNYSRNLDKLQEMGISVGSLLDIKERLFSILRDK